MSNQIFTTDKSDYTIINERRLWVHKNIRIEDIDKKSSLLYIYTKPSDYNQKSIVKIGETGSKRGFRTVRDRVYEQVNTTDTEPLLLLYVLDCEEYIKKGIVKDAEELEAYIHRYFKDDQHTDGAGTEWFKVEMSKVIEIIRVKLKDDHISLDEFKPHFLQELMIRKCVDAINNGEDSINIIAELCARFGKTLTYLELFSRLDNDIMILPAYVHTVFTSFENEIIGNYKDETIGKWTNFKDYKIIDTTVSGNGWEEKLDQNLGKSKMIIFISVQTREESLNKFDIIKNISSDRKFVLLDEADFGSHTESSQKIVDYII
jgi:hypothetical protein